MIGELKKGDRVRITSRKRVPGLRPGEWGTVVKPPKPSFPGQPYVVVQMDRTGLGVWTYLYAEDVEPEGSGP